MLGNHRDAWGFGALDPSSGTAQLMEVFFINIYNIQCVSINIGFE